MTFFVWAGGGGERIGSEFALTNRFFAEQIHAINGATFAHLLCWTTNLTNVPEKSLEIPGKNNQMIECKSLVDFNVKSFRENA